MILRWVTRLCLARPCSSLGTSLIDMGPSAAMRLRYSTSTLRPGPRSAWATLSSSFDVGATSPGRSLPIGKEMLLSSLFTRSSEVVSALVTSASLASS